MWSPFAQRLFLWLWIAALVSNIGTWMQNIGAAWLMTTLSASPLMVALIQTAASLPLFMLALPAGALADVVDRRRLLIFSQGWMLVAAGLLGALTLAHATTPWTLLVLSFALGLGSAMNAPAWQAIVPEVVTRNDLAPAIAGLGVNFNIARALGPALGGVVVSMIGAGANFLLNATSFLAVMAVLYSWKRDYNPGTLPAERVMGAMRAGLRYVRYAPPLRAVLA
ncbi:MAG: MFS transporter, partial [Pseudomonadota bacterium]